MKLLILIALLLPLSSHAFNWKKCRKAGPGTAGLVTSSTQFTSSYGPCSIFGKLPHDKKIFIAQNYEDLKVDIARGQGQYIESYAALSGVPKVQIEKYSMNLKNHYEFIFGKEMNHSPKQVYESLETLNF